MIKLKKIILTCLIASTAFANSFDAKFNYFGNVALSKLSDDDFNINYYNQDSVTGEISLTPYTKGGLQLSFYNDDWMFTSQAIVRKNKGQYKADATWLNVKYNINENWSVRIGRIQTKVLLHSESLEIDYLQLWDHAPEEVYRLMPIRTFNGIEFSYIRVLDEYTFNFSIAPYGVYKGKANGNNDQIILDMDRAYSITGSLENDELLFKLSYSKSRVNIDNDPSVDKLRAGLLAYGNDISKYTFEKRTFHVGTLGFRYILGDFTFDTEAGFFLSNGLTPSSYAGYGMLSYKLNNFTPFAIFAITDNDREFYNTNSVVVVDQTSAVLKRSLNDFLYTRNYSQRSMSLGCKYEFITGMALKVQGDLIRAYDYGSITSQTAQSLGYQRYGIVSRSAGQANKPLYNISIGLSFAY